MTLVVVCGIDGVGKSTLVRSLADELGGRMIRQSVWWRTNTLESDPAFTKADIDHLVGTELGIALCNAYVDDFIEYHDGMSDLLRSGELLISDRWTICVRAFARTFARGQLLSIIARLPADTPDSILYLDADVEVALRRLASRPELHWIEQKSPLAAYRTSYLEELSCWKNVTRIDADATELSVRTSALDAVKRALRRKLGVDRLGI